MSRTAKATTRANPPIPPIRIFCCRLGSLLLNGIAACRWGVGGFGGPPWGGVGFVGVVNMVPYSVVPCCVGYPPPTSSPVRGRIAVHAESGKHCVGSARTADGQRAVRVDGVAHLAGGHQLDVPVAE